MSHFTVLVIGDNVEEQLAPYDENITVIPYAKEAVSEDEKKSFMEYYAKENKLRKDETFEQAYKRLGRDWNGGTWKPDANGVLTEYSTYNPNSKWDWYEIGGRWTGYFKVKKGAKQFSIGEPGLMTKTAKKGTADQIRKGDVDFQYMIKEASARDAKEYDNAMKIIGHLPTGKTWEQVLEETKDTEEAREVYLNQERQKAWKAADTKEFGWDSSPDDFTMSREEYIKIEGEGTLTPYAFVKEGIWYAKGDMGWFGMSNDKVTQKEWNKKVADMIMSLPDDTLLTLVDCHI